MTKMTLWNPWGIAPRDFFDWEDDFDVSSLSNVQMDLYEEGDNVVAEVKAPGFEKDQLDIRVEANQLTVSGKVEEVKEDKDKKRKYYRKEMRNLSFTRTCDLPVSVDANKADASFKNGVLKVILPKKEEAKPKQIQVRLDK
jgi:HSP20 family protein